ncbi:flagellar hook-length control protein [Myxococcus stipitatus DSM 14675]|uniref:Flagellar hook-length control protein n=1 Tax=Myxococcus stipitatus (strain DSM 14675 / JCM 12634 / Mx s8) TaxID=1278073 RepID=L7UCJ6_MYXSD|nr:flagellar hook-length control protein [Myxococcus stipitatus]AGC45590.1 flagellar hook-length control protein [Myxococcus stipitatus DSM 14675]
MRSRINRRAALWAAAVLLAMTVPAPAEAQIWQPPFAIIYGEFHRGCLTNDSLEHVQTFNCGFAGIWEWMLDPVPGETADRKFIRHGDACVEAGETSVLLRKCNGSAWQQWIVQPNEPRYPGVGVKGVRFRSVRNQTACIDNYKSGKVRLWQCGNSYQQQWNISSAAFAHLVFPAPPELHMGMTWRTLRNLDSTVHVGMDTGTNQFQGDTRAREYHPILCINRGFQHPAPPEVPPGTPDGHGWSGGYVNITLPIRGNELKSRAIADSFCSSAFGAAWRMAEWRDGGAYSLWAYGTLPEGERFWVAINDQPANPWN